MHLYTHAPKRTDSILLTTSKKYKCVVTILVSNITAKLLAERMSTSPNQCCYFTVRNEVLTILLHHNFKTDKVQENNVRIVNKNNNNNKSCY